MSPDGPREVDIKSSASDTSAMATAAPRFPFGLDALIAEAKRRMRRRRWLVVGAIIAAAAVAAGFTFGLGPTGPESGSGFATASWDGVSVRTPSSWARVDWCWTGPHLTPIALLTTAHPAPECTKPGRSFFFPPAEHLGMGAVSVELATQWIRPGAKPTWNASVGGQPAIISPPVYGAAAHAAVTCPTGMRREFRSVAVKPPAQDGLFTVDAVICGPHLAAGNAAVDRIIASISFRR